MTAAEVEASVAGEEAAWLGLGAAAGDALDLVYDAAYDPSTIEHPRDHHAILARYSMA